MVRYILIVSVGLLLAGCGKSDEEMHDVGYSDGYAVGYNTACEIRATMINGDFDNEAYSRGYNQGNSAGKVACNNDRRSGTVQ